jgi:hypothetical protein
MKHLIGLSCTLFIAACGMSDDGATESEMSAPDGADGADVADLGAADQPAEVAADPGATDPATQRRATLPAPTVEANGSSTATVLPALAGTAVQINGGTDPAAYAMVTYPIATGAMRATGELTVNPAPGAAFLYALRGTGGGYSSQLRVQRVPGSDDLQAVSTAGIFTCGTAPSGQATQISVVFDGTTKTFDVRIAGVLSPTCTHLPTKVGGPVMGFRLMDAANEGYGGQVEFTNLGLIY